MLAPEARANRVQTMHFAPSVSSRPSFCAKYVLAAIDRACTPPRGERPSCLPDGTFWANLVGSGGMGNVPLKYCNSPSGSFVQ